MMLPFSADAITFSLQPNVLRYMDWLEFGLLIFKENNLLRSKCLEEDNLEKIFWKLAVEQLFTKLTIFIQI